MRAPDPECDISTGEWGNGLGSGRNHGKQVSTFAAQHRRVIKKLCA